MTRPAGDFDTELYQSYLRGLRTVWKDGIYRQVVRDAAALDMQDPEEMERALRRHSSAYRSYGWLERHLQQFKYFGRHGMVPVAEREAEALSRALDEAAQRRARNLILDPDLALPDYYVDSDFHQHRGGVWSDDVDAFVYEWAAERYSFALQDSTAPYAAFARHVVAQGGIRSVLDIGCGFGKSTLPFARLDPSLRVEGVDLSAPCLRLAHLRAEEEDLDIVFRQAAAETLPHEDASVDAVVCYWLMHELPRAVQERVLEEAFRVLSPGGLFASRDMHSCTGGSIGRLLHLGHAVRNNEPFLAELDAEHLRRHMQAIGFAEIALHPVDPRHPGLDPAEPLASERIHVNTVLQGRRPA